jgi:hypothetical protein
LSIAEKVLGEKCAAAERLAVAGAANAQLDRADTNIRAVEERAKTLRAALVEFDEQIASTERALSDAKAQRDRNIMADEIEAMAAAIQQAAPGFSAGAGPLVEAVTKSAASVPEATRFSANVDAMRREVLSAVDLICWELRSAAVRTRAGNANIALGATPGLEQPPPPVLWRVDNEVRTAPAFALVELPKMLLLVALRHQHVDYLNARRVQTLMHVHGSGGFNNGPDQGDPQLVDLDALAADEKRSAQPAVA